MLEYLQQLLERPTSCTSHPISVKLPKLDIPVFNGSIVNWRCFWDQFMVTVRAGNPSGTSIQRGNRKRTEAPTRHHVRALKVMDSKPPGPFMLKLKLDTTTKFGTHKRMSKQPP